jgi:hypothetical protein
MVSPRSKPFDEVFDDVVKDGGVELVSNELAVAHALDQIGLS